MQNQQRTRFVHIFIMSRGFYYHQIEVNDILNVMYINGEWVEEDLSKVEVMNPATGEVVATVPYGGANEATEAVTAAYNSFTGWSNVTAYDRAELLKRWYSLVIENK